MPHVHSDNEMLQGRQHILEFSKNVQEETSSR